MHRMKIRRTYAKMLAAVTLNGGIAVLLIVFLEHFYHWVVFYSKKEPKTMRSCFEDILMTQYSINWTKWDTNTVFEGVVILWPCASKRELWQENTISFPFHFVFFTPLQKEKNDFLSWWFSYWARSPSAPLYPSFGGLKRTVSVPTGQTWVPGWGLPPGRQASRCAQGCGQACLLGLLCPVLGIRVCEAVSLPTWQLTGEPLAILKIGVEMGWELGNVCGHKPQPCFLSCQSPYLKPMFIHQREEESLKIILENVTVFINEPNFILHI